MVKCKIMKKIKPKPVTRRRLTLAGYKWKLYHLTKEEQEALQGPQAHKHDLFYFFKEVENGECRIHKVGDAFYYNGVRLENMDQVPRCEELAKDSKRWDDLKRQIRDTPVAWANTGEGVAEEEAKKAARFPDRITLKGGPLDGKETGWSVAMVLYMTQVNIGTEEAPNIIAPRYKQSKEDKNIYEFDKMF